MATQSPVSSSESGRTAFQKRKPAIRPGTSLAENSPSTAQPNWDVLATFISYGQQSISALSRSPSRAGYSLGARIAGRGSKDLDPLSSPILFNSRSDPVRPCSAARHIESHTPSSLREYNGSTSPFLVERSQTDEPRHSHLDHVRDVTFSANEFQTGTNSKIISECGLYTPPGSIHHTEILPHDPQRVLSDGRKLNMPKQNSLPRSARPRQLRRKAGWSTEDGEASPGVRRNSSNLQAEQSPVFRKAGSKDFNPSHRKSRLETRTSESEESIKQAYITTVTSPSKPQIVSITRRSSSLQDMTSLQYNSRSVSNTFSVTIPETPARDQKVPNGTGRVLEPERTHLIRGNPSNKIEVNVTSPDTPCSSHPITDIHQPNIFYESPRCSVNTTLRHQPLDWILDELEFTVVNFPKVKLQLNSPVIQHLRLPDADRLLTERGLRNAQSRFKAPHSRYSIFRPLSSHPVSSQSPQIPRDILLQNPDLSIFDSLHPDILKDPTLRALQTIFPKAELPALECLQATYLAFNYLSLRYSPSFTSSSLVSLSPGAECPLNLSTVPPKARAMLGMQPPMSIPPPKMWRVCPQTPEHGDDGLRKRVGDLVVSLRDMIDDLLEVFEERRRGGLDYTFLTAVGEVIKMGEERRK